MEFIAIIVICNFIYGNIFCYIQANLWLTS